MTDRIVPRLLVAFFAMFLTASAAAQKPEAETLQTGTNQDASSASRLETEILAPSVEERRARTVGTAAVSGRFDQLLLTAIQSHLGSPYHYTGTGPNSFDCSGLVWRAFQEAGLTFARGPARSYWATFAPATKEEESKFGTLVFFSNLRHVGIVFDEKGFYHASRHNGVIYSPFNEYWLSRIDGFRRVPLDNLQLPALNEKARAARPVTDTASVEEDEGR